MYLEIIIYKLRIFYHKSEDPFYRSVQIFFQRVKKHTNNFPFLFFHANDSEFLDITYFC